MTVKDIVDNVKHALHLDKADDVAEDAVDAVKNEAEKVEAEGAGIVDKAKDAVGGLLDKTDLDEKAIDAFDAAKDKVGGLLDKTDLDEKAMDAIGKAKHKVTDMFDGK